MAFLRTLTMGMGLVLAPLGCAYESGVDDLGAESESIGGTVTGDSAPDEGEDPGLPAPASTTTTSGGADSNSSTTYDYDDEGGGSSGGVEDTVFGMSDDMPLVADIPDIKRGELTPGTLVILEQVRPTTGRAQLGRNAWFYVQDPLADEHMGLRVLLQPGDEVPSGTRAVDLEGWVQADAQGWLLELESAVEGSEEPEVPARRVRVGTLVSNAALDDALVHVREPLALVVTRRGPAPGTVIVGAAASNNGAILVDLRPFGVDADLPPGTLLSHLYGVAEIGGERPVLLPRHAGDIVLAQ